MVELFNFPDGDGVFFEQKLDDLVWLGFMRLFVAVHALVKAE